MTLSAWIARDVASCDRIALIPPPVDFSHRLTLEYRLATSAGWWIKKSIFDTKGVTVTMARIRRRRRRRRNGTSRHPFSKIQSARESPPHGR